jgi:hypothetical protein
VRHFGLWCCLEAVRFCATDRRQHNEAPKRRDNAQSRQDCIAIEPQFVRGRAFLLDCGSTASWIRGSARGPSKSRLGPTYEYSESVKPKCALGGFEKVDPVDRDPNGRRRRRRAVDVSRYLSARALGGTLVLSCVPNRQTVPPHDDAPSAPSSGRLSEYSRGNLSSADVPSSSSRPASSIVETANHGCRSRLSATSRRTRISSTACSDVSFASSSANPSRARMRLGEASDGVESEP